MNDNANNPPGGVPDSSVPGGSGDLYTDRIRSDQMGVGARVPERIAQGTFSTGAIVHEGPGEFVIDFVQGIARPARICARVVMVPQVMAAFLQALRENLTRYESAFGTPKPMPKPNQERRPSIREVYDELKLPDEILSGSYATHAIIAHTPAEFFFDFITRFFPHAAVSSRVYMASSQVPRFLDGLTASFQNFQRRAQQPPPGAPGAQPPQGPDSPPQAPQPPPEGHGPQFPLG